MADPQTVKLVIVASVLLLVFALGARATFDDAISCFRNLLQPPHLLLRALIVMYVIVPAVATSMGLLLDLAKPIRVALLAMAIAPIPPILPGKQLKVGGDREHVFGLLVAISLSSIVLVPVMVGVVGRVFGREASFDPLRVVNLIGITVLVPLAAGLLLRRFAPRGADRSAPWAHRLGTILLAVGLVAVLFNNWPQMVSLIEGEAVFALIALPVIAIAAGHWLGGRDRADRATLAIAAAMRHPGIALAAATASVPEAQYLLAAIMLYLLVAVTLTSLYAAAIRKNRPS